MKLLIKVISVGMGSSGYYTSEVLKRDGASVFHKGVKILNSHVNANSESPARLGQGVSGDDLVGKLVSDAYYTEDGDFGAGLYAEVEIYQQYVDRWGEDKIKDMEFSIFAAVEWERGIAPNGIETNITKRLIPMPINTVDAVVFGGAGGRTIAVEAAEFCNDGTCPITNINVMAVEATFYDMLSRLRDAFNTQYPRHIETDHGVLYIDDNFNDADETYIYIVNYRKEAHYRATYTIDGNGGISIQDRDSWQRVVATTNFEPVSENKTIPSDFGGNEENKMTLQEALAKNAELEAQNGVISAEKAQLTTQLSELKTAFNKMSTEHRVMISERAVSDALKNVQFNNNEVRGLVIERLTRGVKWKDDGSVDTEMLAESATPYTDGTSSLVFSSESGGAYKIPSYTTGFSPVPQGDKTNSSEYESILNSAVDGEFNF